MWKHNNVGCIDPDELIRHVASFSELLYKSTCYDLSIRHVTSSGLHKSYFCLLGDDVHHAGRNCCHCSPFYSFCAGLNSTSSQLTSCVEAAVQCKQHGMKLCSMGMLDRLHHWRPDIQNPLGILLAFHGIQHHPSFATLLQLLIVKEL